MKSLWIKAPAKCCKMLNESRVEMHSHAGSLNQELRAASRTFSENWSLYFSGINYGTKNWVSLDQLWYEQKKKHYY